MAHDDGIRRAVRGSFVFDQLSMEVAAAKHGVPHATVRNWKRACKEQGDDWDKARGAQMIAGGAMEDVMRQMVAAVVQQAQSTMETIQADTEIPACDRVKMITSLVDSLNKLGAVVSRFMPETDKLAVATDVAKRLAEFVRTHYPQHAPAFAEILGPFGDELARAYG